MIRYYEPKTTENLINKFSAEFDARLMTSTGVRIERIERRQQGVELIIVYRLTNGYFHALIVNPDNGTFRTG